MNGAVRQELLSAVGAVLDERDKAVLFGLYVDGLSYRALAKRLKTSARTIQRWRAVAINKLSAKMGDEIEALLGQGDPDAQSDPTPPSRPSPMRVPWATCHNCGRERVELDADRLCPICGPIDQATRLASAMG